MNDIHAISDNLFGFYRYASGISQPAGPEDRIQVVGSPGGPWPSYILGKGALKGNEVLALVNDIKEDRLPAFWIHELASENELDSILAENGIRMMNRWSGMILKRNQPFELKDDCISREITIENECEQWAGLVSREVMNSRSLDPGMVLRMQQQGRVKIFGRWQEEELVSTTLVFIETGVAGIYFVATSKDRRGKGHGTAVLCSAINACISEGLTTFVLHATSMGKGLYNRIGFADKVSYGIYWMLGKK